MDVEDQLSGFRDRFILPKGLIYLDGNSLGPMPVSTNARLAQVANEEWATGLIRSWNSAGWMDLPERIGNKIGRLVGAGSGQVICCDSTSINVFKTISAALALNPHRKLILSTVDNFPTDLYIIQGLIQQLGAGHELRLVPADDLASHINEQVAVVTLTHCNYKSGRMYDMEGLTALAHANGVLTMWDLAHSAGAVPVDLDGSGADFAVGCGYKFLNGGPGAPAFLYVAERHQAGVGQPLSGWLGHAQPFEFSSTYKPAPGIHRYITGTAPILSLAALECGVDLMLEADMTRIRAKSLALSDLLIALVAQRCAGHSLQLITPENRGDRSSQVSFRHPDSYAIMQGLIASDVIGDFRAPDILRLGLTPLYTSFMDVWNAVATLGGILDARSWDRPEWKTRKKVT